MLWIKKHPVLVTLTSSILFVLIVCLVMSTIITRVAFRNLNKWVNEPPVGINYVKSEIFNFPEDMGILMGNGRRQLNHLVVKYPKTNEEKVLQIAEDYKSVCSALLSHNEKFMCYTTFSESGSSIVVWPFGFEPKSVFDGYNIYSCSLSPDDKKIAFIASKTSGHPEIQVKGHLAVLDIKSGNICFSDMDGFRIKGTPPIWISDKKFIIDRPKEIVLYNMDNNESKSLVRGDYYSPVLWKNEFLIFKGGCDNKVYISDLDGTDIQMLFKSQFIFGQITVSPDNKYLACQAQYVEDMEFVIEGRGKPKPGASLFMMNLEDKTFTYYLADEPNLYEWNLSWYPGRGR